jgi:hypothetical protein
MIKLEKNTNNISKINSKVLKLIPKNIITKKERDNYARTLWNIKNGRRIGGFRKKGEETPIS